MRATLTQMLLIMLLLLCLAPVALAAATKQPSQPDVILVTIDTLRADHVGCYGYKHIATPALDGLARQGIRFANAFTASPITNSSHASILTGLYPSSHGVSDFGVPLAPAHATIAELLKARGYRTAAFIGAVILDSKQLAPGFDQGFDEYDNFPSSPEGSRFGRLERRAMTVIQHAEKWMSANPSRPRFVWVHLYDPHDPYEPPPPYSSQYQGRLYDGEIAYADHALGELLAYLRAHGRYDNTLIIVVGDHGEGLGEHGEDTHGIFLYDSTTHVPLITKLPGGSHAGEVVTSQVRTIDIAPTILSYTERGGGTAPRDAKLDGASLVPAITSATAPDRPAVGETDYPLRFGWAPLRSLRTSAFKFIEAPRPELYDLKSDPGELHSQYEPWNQEVQRSRELLATLKKNTPENGGTVPQTTVDELKALGYLGPEGATAVPEPSLLPDPKDKIAVHNLLHIAMMAGEDGRQDLARRVLARAVELDPASPIAFSQLGQIEMKQGDAESARRHLSRAHELNPLDPTVALELGRAMIKTGDLRAARESLESALKLAPGQGDARELLGSVLMQLNQPKEAVQQYEAAVFVAPNSVSAHIGFARSLAASGDYERAISEAKEAIRLKPGYRDAYAVLQQCYEKTGNPALAREAAQRAASIEPHK